MFLLPLLIPAPGEIEIVEVMYDPSAVPDRAGEYIELQNVTASALDLTGLTLFTATGQRHTLSSARGATQLAPFGLLLLGANSNRMENGGLNLDYVWSDLTLGNGSEQLRLQSGTSVLTSFAWGVETDLPDPSGASLQRASGCFDPPDASYPACWCSSTHLWPGGQDLGSPGSLNPDCPAPPIPDQDGDTYAGPQVNGDDCADQDSAIHPGAQELPYDGIDQDCSGSDWVDVDGDGWPALQAGGSDCDDQDPGIHPDADEAPAPDQPDAIDNDCDGVVDEGTLFFDDDGDGFTEEQGDCNDGHAQSYPDAPELQDGQDNNCDGLIDPQTTDGDLDGHTPAEGDCDDQLPQVHPGAQELENDRDDDCDGRIDNDTSRYDDDGDGFSERDGDCDDHRADHAPTALDPCGDGLDQDCDGVPAPCPEQTGCQGGTVDAQPASGLPLLLPLLLLFLKHFAAHARRFPRGDSTVRHQELSAGAGDFLFPENSGLASDRIRPAADTTPAHGLPETHPATIP